MDLNLRTVGRPALPISAHEVRPLGEADLALLALPRGSTAPTVAKLRDSHHALAKCLASGMRNAEASIATGYSGSRISILLADPAFQELVEHYRTLATEATADLAARMGTMALDAIEELRERMETNPEDFSPGLLLEITKTLADRTGHGPSTKTTTTNVNVNMADLLRAGRERAAAARPSLEGPVLELTLAEPVSAAGPAGEEPVS